MALDHTCGTFLGKLVAATGKSRAPQKSMSGCIQKQEFLLEVGDGLQRERRATWDPACIHCTLYIMLRDKWLEAMIKGWKALLPNLRNATAHQSAHANFVTFPLLDKGRCHNLAAWVINRWVPRTGAQVWNPSFYVQAPEDVLGLHNDDGVSRHTERP